MLSILDTASNTGIPVSYEISFGNFSATIVVSSLERCIQTDQESVLFLKGSIMGYPHNSLRHGSHTLRTKEVLVSHTSKVPDSNRVAL